jgi:hypothetical protein
MTGNNLLADGKPQPCARGFAFVGAHPVEFFEQVGQGLLWNSQAGVVDRESPTLTSDRGADGDASVGIVVLDGIADQVENQLFKFVAVGLHRRKIIRDLDPEGNLTFLGFALRPLTALLEQRRSSNRVRWNWTRPDSSRARSRKVDAKVFKRKASA